MLKGYVHLDRQDDLADGVEADAVCLDLGLICVGVGCTCITVMLEQRS